MVPSFISTLFQQRYDLGVHLPFQLIRYVDIFHHVFGNIILLIFRLFPINPNKIVIANLKGSGYGCNPKYIVDILAKEIPTYDLVWLILDKNQEEKQMPESVRRVNYYSIQAIYELATARVWIRNIMCALDLGKRQNQLYIQTWHGSGPKKAGVVTSKESTRKYQYFFKCLNCRINVVLSCSKYQTRVFREGFLYSGPILECGFPRNDIFYQNNKELAISVKKRLNLKPDKKYVLYAPTFRNDLQLGILELDYSGIINACHIRFGGEWILLGRLHPSLAIKYSEIFVGAENIIDVSQYPDMQELLLISDILITDYSSSMFDYALTQRPCYLYIPDIAAYVQNRGLYMDLDTLPFPSAETNLGLVDKITKFDAERYHADLMKFFEDYGVVDDGTASSQVVDYIRKYFMTNNF